MCIGECACGTVPFQELEFQKNSAHDVHDLHQTSYMILYVRFQDLIEVDQL